MPTIAVMVGCYAVWLATVTLAQSLGPLIVFASLSLTLALHSSLQHEALHGHPFRLARLNEALVYLPLGLVFPFRRFRDTHLAHHRDELLTDPYDDPESNYFDPQVWHKLPAWQQHLLRWNNTLAGRILLGPAVGFAYFFMDDWRKARSGDRRVRNAYWHHVIGLVLLATILWTIGEVTWWLYLLAAYFALGILRIRTFLEHRAFEASDGRTVVIEDRGPLAFLFLNNNFHAVHHKHPRLAWYRIPAAYAREKAAILEGNGYYRYRSYAEVFRRYFFKAKDPVPHPLRPGS